MTKRLAIAVTGCALAAFAQHTGGDLGFKDTPMLPGDRWHVHDPDRPHPHVVTPGAKPGDAPSDAEILFDGKDLSKWMQKGKDGKLFEPKWPVRDGYFEVDATHGDLVTKESVRRLPVACRVGIAGKGGAFEPIARKQRRDFYEFV